MAEVPPEQVEAQFARQPHLFNQAPAGSSKESQTSTRASTSKPLPKGVVLDKDGKPCRTCTSVAAWRALTKQAKAESSPSTSTSTSTSTSPSTSTSTSTSTSNPSTTPSTTMTTPTVPLAAPSTPSPSETPPDCPPDVEQLGRSTWTLLHSMAATYPEKADAEHQSDMRGFLKLFSKLYPCWVCADDFRAWMAHPSGRNQPRLGGRADFGWWLCEAHNEVNRKLGKKEFDCRFWEERWRTGWKDGRCD